MGSECQPLVLTGESYLVADTLQTDRQTAAECNPDLLHMVLSSLCEQGSHPAHSYGSCHRYISASGHLIPETSTQAAPVPWVLSEADKKAAAVFTAQ